MTDLEKNYLDIYSFEKINEISKVVEKVIKEENISDEEARKKYNSYHDYIAKKLEINVKDAKELQKKLKTEISKIQNIYDRFTPDRREGFKYIFKDFYDWFEEQDDCCYYCKTSSVDLKILFKKGLIKSKKFTETLHIERLCSNKRYTKDNMVFACSLCNNAKSDMITEPDFQKYFAKRMGEYLKEKIDNNSDIVYLSDVLEKKFESFYREFTCLLENNGVNYSIIPNTKDIWCRDFMPIQISPHKLISYKYKPDYLKDYPSLQTDFIDVNKELKLEKEYEITDMDIILDGGNVIKSKNCVILTDKIFAENSQYNKDTLLLNLKDYFEVEKIIILPWDKDFDKDDYFGHSDGMVRFINQNKVLVNGFINEYKKVYKTRFFDVLEENSLEYEILDMKHWGYINFLQMKDVIILPIFGMDEDKRAEEKIKILYPNFKILTINSIDIEKEGGVLNCISWNLCH